MQLVFADDYLQWDNVEPGGVVIERSRRTGLDLAAVAVAKRRPIRRAEKSPSGGAYLGFEANWLVPRALLKEAMPGDVVVQGDTRWTVLTATLQHGDATWALGCVDLVIAERLFDAVNIEQAGPSYDDAGAFLRAWPSGTPAGGKVLYSGLACRVQPMTQDVQEERGVRGDETHYEIYLSRQVVLNVRECRVVWQGKTLDLVSYEGGNRLDVLPVLKAELRP
jgi:hypothetical protein